MDTTINPSSAPGTVPTLNRLPTTDEKSGRQAMQFQPQSGMMGAVIGMSPFESWNMDYSGNGSSSAGNRCRNPGVTASVNGLPLAWPGRYAYFRMILNDPSVRFVRSLAYSPILATKWAVRASKNAPKEAAEMAQEMFNDLIPEFLDDAVRAIDYGWAPFEQVFQEIEGAILIKKLKPLLHDLTSIFVDDQGELTGFNNNGTQIDAVKSALVTYDKESGNLYGRGRCYNLTEIIPWWREANDGAVRYDRKIAGVFLVCHYPPGNSINKDGIETANHIIAQQLLDSISAGVPIAVCNEFAGDVFNDYLQNVSAADRTRWKLEVMEDKGSRQPGFRERLEYLDKNKARAYNVPERAAFEAQASGSRADSESHGDIILVGADLNNIRFAKVLNGSRFDVASPVNNFLRLNWGPKAVGTLKLVPASLDDQKKAFLRDVGKQLLGSSPTLLPKVTDVKEMFNQMGMPVPSVPATDQDIVDALEDESNRQNPSPEAMAKAKGPPGTSKLGRWVPLIEQE